MYAFPFIGGRVWLITPFRSSPFQNSISLRTFYFFYSYNNSKIIKLHVVWNILLYHHLYTIIRYYELHGRRNWRWFTQMTSAARAHINTRSHQWVHRCEWPTLRDKMDTFISLSWMSLSWKHRLRVVYRVNMIFCNSLKVYSQLLNFYYGSCHIGTITFTIRATSINLRCPMHKSPR